MTYKTLNEFLAFIILCLLVVNGQQFIPGPRVGHTATFLGGKIYYIGGIDFAVDVDLSASDFFYFSLEKNFSWVDLKSQGVKFPYTAWHTSDIGGANQDSIFIIGGRQLETTSLVYKFNTKTNAITAPITQGITPPRREDISSVSYGGKIYILDGRMIINNNNTYFDRFDILDTVTMNWQVGSLVNAPIPRCHYTATLVNGVIYYIGGMRRTETGQLYVLMSDIWQYDIDGNTWSLKTATAARTLPGQRIGHSAVLVDGKICIYGGTFFPAGARPMPSTEQIAMLDTTTLVWSTPQLKPTNIPNLVYHTATLIGKLMLLAFGNITDVSGVKLNNNNFYLFDLSKSIVTWKSFTARQLAPPPPPSPPPSSLSPPPTSRLPTASPPTSTASPTDLSTPTNTVVIGLSVGLVAVGLAGIVAFSLFYRYKKNQNKENENGSGHLGIPGASDSQIPSGGDIHYQKYSSQFTPYSNSQNPYYSHTSTLTQSQGRSLSHEYSALPLPQERFSQHSYNYSSGSGTPPITFNHGTNH